MRTLAAAVLAFESLVIALSIPVALVVYDASSAFGWIAGGVAISCIVVAGLLRHSWAYGLGWAVQAFAVLSGFVVPFMFFLGGVFAVLWFFALRLGGKADALKAAHDAQS